MKKTFSKIEILFLKLKAHGLKKIIRYLVSSFYSRLWAIPIKGSYSQKGEDLVIEKLLKSKSTGFYVDVGAHDPKFRNNTKRFYKKGWHGINIEPDYDNYLKLIEDRPKDINLNIGISNDDRVLDFYRFIPDAISTFSKENLDQYLKYGFKLREIRRVKTKCLSEVLTKYVKNKTIDFISVDAEGYDLKVLESNDWRKFIPTVVCVEGCYHYNAKNVFEKTEEIRKFMSKAGYGLAYTNNINDIYVKTDVSNLKNKHLI